MQERLQNKRFLPKACFLRLFCLAMRSVRPLREECRSVLLVAPDAFPLKRGGGKKKMPDVSNNCHFFFSFPLSLQPEALPLNSSETILELMGASHVWIISADDKNTTCVFAGGYQIK